MNCETCRYYEMDDDYVASDWGYGLCKRAGQGDDYSDKYPPEDEVLFFSDGVNYERTWINVRPNFGCVMHEKK